MSLLTNHRCPFTFMLPANFYSSETVTYPIFALHCTWNQLSQLLLSTSLPLSIHICSLFYSQKYLKSCGGQVMSLVTGKKGKITSTLQKSRKDNLVLWFNQARKQLDTSQVSTHSPSFPEGQEREQRGKNNQLELLG